MIDIGVIEQVLRPLQSGKEAQVFLVRHEGEVRIAKVYKDAQNRSFKHRSQYTEGRKVRNSRQNRAMQNKSRFGKEMEATWKAAEVQVFENYNWLVFAYHMPYDFIDGVLIMEFICTKEESQHRVWLKSNTKKKKQVYIEKIDTRCCKNVVCWDYSR